MVLYSFENANSRRIAGVINDNKGQQKGLSSSLEGSCPDLTGCSHSLPVPILGYLTPAPGEGGATAPIFSMAPRVCQLIPGIFDRTRD